MRNLGPYPFTQVSITKIQLGPGPNLHGKKTSDFALCVDDNESAPPTSLYCVWMTKKVSPTQFFALCVDDKESERVQM